MTPHQMHLAGQASRETNPTKVKGLLDELCHAIDGEREGNRESREGCVEDCTEHPKPFPCD
jgi:hypothetical protein